jgi:hypothetical protein
MSLNYEPASEPLHKPPNPDAGRRGGGKGGEGAGALLFFFMTLEPRVERCKRLWAFSTSPLRNRFRLNVFGQVNGMQDPIESSLAPN